MSLEGGVRSNLKLGCNNVQMNSAHIPRKSQMTASGRIDRPDRIAGRTCAGHTRGSQFSKKLDNVLRLDRIVKWGEIRRVMGVLSQFFYSIAVKRNSISKWLRQRHRLRRDRR